MNVLIVSPGADHAGVGVMLKRAFDRHCPDVSVRHVKRAQKFFDFDTDIHWRIGDPDTEKGVRRIGEKADLIHVMDDPRVMDWFPEGKPFILHEHGAFLRRNQGWLLPMAQNHIMLIATHDMMQIAPGLRWLPNPCNIDAMQEYRRAYASSGRVRVIQSPSKRSVKGTDAFLAAAEALGDDVEIDIIDGVDHRTCLTRKAQGDVLFDNFRQGYAVAAIEAWGMGLPVLSGASDPMVAKTIRGQAGYLPYLDVTEATLAGHLADIVADPWLREDYAARGWQYVHEVHDERIVVEQLKAIYEEALG